MEKKKEANNESEFFDYPAIDAGANKAETDKVKSDDGIEWIESDGSRFAVVGQVDPKLIEGKLTHVKKDGRVCIMERKKTPQAILDKRQAERDKKRAEQVAKNKVAQKEYRKVREEIKEDIKALEKKADELALDRKFDKVAEFDAKRKQKGAELNEHLNKKTWRNFL